MTNPHTIQEVEDLILKEFNEKAVQMNAKKNVLTGNYISTADCAELQNWLRSQIHKIAAQTLSGVVPEEYEYPYYDHKQGWASCRQEVLRRGKEFLNEI